MPSFPASSLEAFPPVPASKVNRDIHLPRLVKRRWVWPTVASVAGFLAVSTLVVAVFAWGV